MNSLGSDGNDPRNGVPDGADGPTHANGPAGGGDRWLHSVVENSSEIIKALDLEGTLRAVLEMGCDMVQGFHFAKPLPPEAASKFLTE